MELLISCATAEMEIRIFFMWIGGRGWERREVAALAPWLDEKPSKPGEEEKTGRAKVKLPRPSDGRREKGDSTKLFLLPSGSLWSIRRPENSELLYMKCMFGIHCKHLGNF